MDSLRDSLNCLDDGPAALCRRAVTFCLLAAGIAPTGIGSLRAQQPDSGSALPGTLLEEVASTTDSSQRFALFFPTGYDTTRTWPVLFAMDPRARALSPVSRLRAAADRYGYVIASSYRTQSDSAPDPTEAAFLAMFAETRRRVKVDLRRVYLAGFSGTARDAWMIAYKLIGHAAGIFGAGAGLASGWQLPEPAVGGPAPVFFGTVGNSDFNYEELVGVDSALDRTSVRHHVATFDGPHSWPPEPLMREGVEWFELQAMRSGAKPTNAAWIDSLYQVRLEAGRALESAGDSFGAWQRYRLTVGDFEGLHETDEAAGNATRLQRTGEVQGALKQQRRNVAMSGEYLTAVRNYVAKVRASKDPPDLESSLKALKVRELERELQTATDSLEVQAVRRLLSYTFVVMASYESSEAFRANNPARALALLNVADAIRPGSSSVCDRRKRAMAMLGQDTSASAAPCPAPAGR